MDNNELTINDIVISNTEYFKLITKTHNIQCKYSDLNQVKMKIKRTLSC